MSYILKLLLSVIHNLVIVNTFNTHNYPYNIWGNWHINFLDKNLPKNSVIKIFPSKIEIITTKDILGGVILMEKEYKCKYMYICLYIYVYLCVCMHMFVLNIFMYIYVYICVFMCMYIYVYIHKYTYVPIHIYTYIYA